MGFEICGALELVCDSKSSNNAVSDSAAQSPSAPLALFANCVRPVRGAVT